MIALKTLAPVNVSTTAVTIAPTPSYRLDATAVTIQSDLANTAKVYVGESGVTALTGIELDIGDSVTIGLEADEYIGQQLDLSTIFAIAASGTQKIRISWLKRTR